MNRTEAFFYNAIAAGAEGDYQKIKKWNLAYGTWSDAWTALRGTLSHINPEKEWDGLTRAGAHLLLREDRDYPTLLKETASSPFGLYVMGTLPPEKTFTIAIVGTRKATDSGKLLARSFARELGYAGGVIVSGLALGIDTEAHKGALEAGAPTVAVLGNGLPRIYPRANDSLGKSIVERGGAITSEYPIGSPSLPYRFLERNRIVAGLSRGTLIVEAGERSGSLVTAGFALEENRDVFVLPGPVRHPNFVGSHALIRAGAELVTSPKDILAAFAVEANPFPLEAALQSPEEKAVFETVKTHGGPLSIDKITELTNLKTPIVSQTLSLLLLKNIVKEEMNGYSLA